MGAALSKMWASVRSALKGGAPGGKSTQQHQQTNVQPKDIESGEYSPTKTTEPSLDMSGIKKYEITEVCSRVVIQGVAEG